ncbi:hypothetical protein ACP70R_032815 [Stipagrostis hirtigluma subsp. patula]
MAAGATASAAVFFVAASVSGAASSAKKTATFATFAKMAETAEVAPDWRCFSSAVEMAPSFGRSISFPLGPTRSRAAAARHVRSVSLPSCRSHPLLACLASAVCSQRHTEEDLVRLVSSVRAAAKLSDLAIGSAANAVVVEVSTVLAEAMAAVATVSAAVFSAVETLSSAATAAAVSSAGEGSGGGDKGGGRRCGGDGVDGIGRRSGEDGGIGGCAGPLDGGPRARCLS